MSYVVGVGLLVAGYQRQKKAKHNTQALILKPLKALTLRHKITT